MIKKEALVKCCFLVIKMKKNVDKFFKIVYSSYCVLQLTHFMHEWLSGGLSPCQGEGRGFESRLVIFSCPFLWAFFGS